MNDYGYVKTHISQRAIALGLVDSLIQGLLLVAVMVLISGFIYLIH